MAASDEAPGRQRLDKWLWFARVVKTREAAAALVESGKVRLNGQKTLKPGHGVRAGDILTIVVSESVAAQSSQSSTIPPTAHAPYTTHGRVFETVPVGGIPSAITPPLPFGTGRRPASAALTVLVT